VISAERPGIGRDVEVARWRRGAIGRDQFGGVQRQRIERIDLDDPRDAARREARAHPLLRSQRWGWCVGAGDEHHQRWQDY
jgi:hypothetical protein